MAKSRTQTPAPPSLPVDPSYPPLPSAEKFDILPPLHALLSRLDPTLNTYTAEPAPAAPTPNPGTASTSPSLPNGGAGADPSGVAAGLEYKDAATAAGFLKTRIRKLLAELGGLEDMDRTVEEQEVEIKELEERVRGQREMLVRLGEEAALVLEEAMVRENGMKG